jgi:hypothetical protein
MQFSSDQSKFWHQFHKNQKGGTYKKHLTVTSKVLATLFGRSIPTIRRWIRSRLIDPTDLLDIIDKYNNREKVDRRRIASQESREEEKRVEREQREGTI